MEQLEFVRHYFQGKRIVSANNDIFKEELGDGEFYQDVLTFSSMEEGHYSAYTVGKHLFPKGNDLTISMQNETFTIKLLESNNCVGWQLFHYMDNDPNSGTGDKTSVDSNKGIYNSDYELYTEFTDRLSVMNKNVYNLLDYFNNKNAAST